MVSHQFKYKAIVTRACGMVKPIDVEAYDVGEASRSARRAVARQTGCSIDSLQVTSLVQTGVSDRT